MRDSVHCQTGAVTHEVIECTTSVKSTMDSPFRRILAILGVMTILGALGVAAFHRTSTFNSNLKVVQPEEMSTYALPITFAQFSVLPPAFNDIEGYATLAEPLDACTPLTNEEIVQDTIVIATRGGCEFYKKAQHIEDAGGIAFVVSNEIDNFLPMPNWGTEGQTRGPSLVHSAPNTKAKQAMSPRKLARCARVHAPLSWECRWARKHARQTPHKPWPALPPELFFSQAPRDLYPS